MNRERAGRVKAATARVPTARTVRRGVRAASGASEALTRPKRAPAKWPAGATAQDVSFCRGVVVARGTWRGSGRRRQGRLARYGLARRNARARRLPSTNATASCSVIVLPRFSRCARASAGESLNRTTFPPTTAVAYMTSAYPNEWFGQSEGVRARVIGTFCAARHASAAAAGSSLEPGRAKAPWHPPWLRRAPCCPASRSRRTRHRRARDHVRVHGGLHGHVHGSRLTGAMSRFMSPRMSRAMHCAIAAESVCVSGLSNRGVSDPE